MCRACLTPVCRQPDGIPTLASGGVKTGKLLASGSWRLNRQYWVLAR